MYLLALDVGLNGGLCFYNKNVNQKAVYAMPTIRTKIKRGKYKTEINWKEVYKMMRFLKDKNAHVVFEKMVTGKGYSKSSVAAYNEQIGHIKAFCVTLNVGYTEILAKQWQAEIFKGIKPVKRPSRTEKGKLVNDTKAMALTAFKAYCKDISLPIGKKGKVLDGCVDAALIALYGVFIMKK